MKFPIDWYKKTFGEEGKSWKEKIVSPIPQGERNMDFASIIGGLLYRFPMDEWESIVWQMVQDKNKLQEKPLSPQEMRTTFNSIAKSETQRRHQGGEIKNVVTTIGEEELNIVITLEQATINFRVRNIIGSIMEAKIVTWLEKATGMGYEIPFNLRLKSDGNKELWAKVLKDAFNHKENKEIYPWTILIAKVVNEIENHISSKKQDSSYEEIQEKPYTWMFEPFIQENQINTFFGLGSGGKTLLSMYFARLLAQDYGVKSLFIDYENDEGGWKHQMKRLIDADNSGGNLFYFNSEQMPLAEQVDKIKEVIKRRGIKLVIVDSASLATGDSTSDEKASVRLASALKMFKVTVVLIAHQRKNDGDRTPIGSIQYENQSRNVWNISSVSDEKNQNTLHIVCKHTKANNTRLRKDLIGYRIDFSDTYISVVKEDPQKWAGDKLTVAQRIKNSLLDGESSAKDISDSIGVSIQMVKKELTKRTDIFENPNSPLWRLKID